MITATYDPADNKIRVSSSCKFDQETFDRLRGAGFQWAPGQKIFIAPMWTPERFDLAVELAGEVTDEDTTLVERAEERAERFTGHSENRARDAQRASDAVSAITENIPLGQPILVGHHSQARAERDAKRIEKGLERAVQMWETSDYWKNRARGALRLAKYKERTDVRARRIKGLEADLRKREKSLAESAKFTKLWSKQDLTLDQAKAIANFDPKVYGTWSKLESGAWDVETARKSALEHHAKVVTWDQRWADHINNRLAYERAMLGEAGGLVADKFDLQPGGRVRFDTEWATIIRVTRKDGKAVSVSTNARFARIRGVEEIQDYQPPTEEAAAAVKAKTTLPPLCNYKHETFLEMTKAEWDKTYKDYKGSTVLGKGLTLNRWGRDRFGGGNPFEAYGPHRVREVVRGGGLQSVFITDLKVTLPPPAEVNAEPVVTLPAPEPDMAALRERDERIAQARAEPPSPAEALKAALKNGVQVVSAAQLFPTPVDLADRMVDELGLFDGARVLEPSAGTGNLVKAVLRSGKTVSVTAIEINPNLCTYLSSIVPLSGQLLEVVNKDFMGPLAIGKYDFVLMNPPFENANDIKHIRQAMTYLKPGGRLVAICAGGPRQHRDLGAQVEAAGGTWEPLPAGTFESSGTNVNTVLLTMDAREEVQDCHF